MASFETVAAGAFTALFVAATYPLGVVFGKGGTKAFRRWLPTLDGGACTPGNRLRRSLAPSRFLLDPLPPALQSRVDLRRPEFHVLEHAVDRREGGLRADAAHGAEAVGEEGLKLFFGHEGRTVSSGSAGFALGVSAAGAVEPVVADSTIDLKISESVFACSGRTLSKIRPKFEYDSASCM